MRFGKIEYLNLLTFDIFLKQYKTTSNFKSILNLKKNYPSRLNKEFLYNRIDAGFISSIAGINSHYKSRTCKVGIIANKEVWSVLLIDSKTTMDYQSATSNALSIVLGLTGGVLIGDRALKYYYDNENKLDMLDMATLWHKKTRLPFVFGYLCFNKYGDFYQKLAIDFNKKVGKNKFYKGIKIPHYLIMPYVKNIGISKKFAQQYLKNIYYTIGTKEYTALIRFYRELRLKHIKPPKRF